MLVCDNIKERRKHQRVVACNNAFTGLGPNSVKIGKIIDISRGGLAFQNAEQKTKFFESAELSIIVNDDDLNINQVPFKFQAKMISVTDISKRNPFNFTKARRFAVEFQDLSDLQIFWLDYFIKNHTLSEV